MPRNTKRSYRRQSALAKKLAILKRSDRAVLFHLDQLRKKGDVCTASHNAIASAANISPRQVQICVDRLIEVGLLERVGYDFGNANRSRRGTIYRLLIAPETLGNIEKIQESERIVQDILRHQQSIKIHMEQLSLAQNKLISLLSDRMKHPDLNAV